MLKFNQILLLEKKDPHAGGIAFTHITTSHPSTTHELFNKITTKLSNSSNHVHLGGGVQTETYAHKDKPEVIKVTKSPYAEHAHEDTAVQFHKVANDHAAGNPHLPRTYHITSVKTQDGFVHVSHMEKLHDLLDIKGEERHGMLKHAFGSKKANEIMNIKKHQQPVLDYMTSHIQKSYTNRHAGRSHFNKALRLVGKVQKSSLKTPHQAGETDFNTGNFMGRKTPHGTQLVITDPLVS